MFQILQANCVLVTTFIFDFNMCLPNLNVNVCIKSIERVVFLVVQHMGGTRCFNIPSHF